MISVRPEDLRFITRLASLRRPPGPGDGKRAWVHCHELSYARGQLSLRTTDNRVFLEARIPATGAADPWAAVVQARGFNHIAAYLEGGCYELDPSGPAVMLLKQPNYGYPPRRPRGAV